MICSVNILNLVLSTESALDDLDLNDFGVSALERSLESTSGLPSVGVMLGIMEKHFKKC